MFTVLVGVTSTRKIKSTKGANATNTEKEERAKPRSVISIKTNEQETTRQEDEEKQNTRH
jgi:hypothetical protein